MFLGEVDGKERWDSQIGGKAVLTSRKCELVQKLNAINKGMSFY